MNFALKFIIRASNFSQLACLLKEALQFYKSLANQSYVKAGDK